MFVSVMDLSLSILHAVCSVAPGWPPTLHHGMDLLMFWALICWVQAGMAWPFKTFGATQAAWPDKLRLSPYTGCDEGP